MTKSPLPEMPFDVLWEASSLDATSIIVLSPHSRSAGCGVEDVTSAEAHGHIWLTILRLCVACGGEL
ncbi:hypothetical protein HWV62_34889 [Athelia sp. TMB]|nr:hypothetical protein HWV62_34889 [Athelia sp. TMB]